MRQMCTREHLSFSWETSSRSFSRSLSSACLPVYLAVWLSFCFRLRFACVVNKHHVSPPMEREKNHGVSFRLASESFLSLFCFCLSRFSAVLSLVQHYRDVHACDVIPGIDPRKKKHGESERDIKREREGEKKRREKKLWLVSLSSSLSLSFSVSLSLPCLSDYFQEKRIA